MENYDWELIGKNAIKNLMDVFILPEIIRRQEANLLPVPLHLKAAQIVFFPDGRPPEIRINSEVKGSATVKYKENVSKEIGEPVREDEVEEITGFSLAEDDDPDCGHATLLNLSNSWVLLFDFRTNKAFAVKNINAAEEFLHSAQLCFDHKLWKPFIANLYLAAELTAKAELLSVFGVELRNSRKHKHVSSRFNQYAHWGNVMPSHRSSFNKLSQMRDPARYPKPNEDFSLDHEEALELLINVKDMFTTVKKRFFVEKPNEY